MKPDEFRKNRKLLGLSQERLAPVIGRTRRQIIRYETGDAAIPIIAQLAMECLVWRQAAKETS